MTYFQRLRLSLKTIFSDRRYVCMILGIVLLLFIIGYFFSSVIAILLSFFTVCIFLCYANSRPIVSSDLELVRPDETTGVENTENMQPLQNVPVYDDVENSMTCDNGTYENGNPTYNNYENVDYENADYENADYENTNHYNLKNIHVDNNPFENPNTQPDYEYYANHPS